MNCDVCKISLDGRYFWVDNITGTLFCEGCYRAQIYQGGRLAEQYARVKLWKAPAAKYRSLDAEWS